MDKDVEEFTGFFVKVSDIEYNGPFVNLNGARDMARSMGPNKEIYHGVLKISNNGVDSSDLHLIPKVKK